MNKINIQTFKVTYYKNNKLDVYRTVKSHAIYTLQQYINGLVDNYNDKYNNVVDNNESLK